MCVWSKNKEEDLFLYVAICRYAASVYTISVGSASQKGRAPWYGEKCPSTMTVTYSSGAYEDQMIVSVERRDHTQKNYFFKRIGNRKCVCL